MDFITENSAAMYTLPTQQQCPQVVLPPPPPQEEYATDASNVSLGVTTKQFAEMMQKKSLYEALNISPVEFKNLSVQKQNVVIRKFVRIMSNPMAAASGGVGNTLSVLQYNSSVNNINNIEKNVGGGGEAEIGDDVVFVCAALFL